MLRQNKEASLKSYLATAPFHNNLFKYTTSMTASFQTQGDLSVLPSATAVNCPAGRVLRENGKKLFPGAHPVNTVNGAAVTFPSSTMMVGVFDNQSGLSGFIDVNSPMFAVYNTDRPNHLKDAVDPVGGLTDQGVPVKTNGQITSRVVALGTIAAGTVTLDTSLGQIFSLTGPSTAVTLNVNTTTLVSGVVVRLILTGGAGAITLGTNFKKSAVLGTAGVVTGTITVSFVSDGTNLYELARTAALT
jgi:hypothetical protein